jgi:hypothetical protein
MFLLVYISANHTNTIFKISLRILLTWKSLSTIYSIRRITDNRTCGAEIEDDDFLVSIVMWHEKKGNHLGIALLVKTYKTNIFNIEEITNNDNNTNFTNLKITLRNTKHGKIELNEIILLCLKTVNDNDNGFMIILTTTNIKIDKLCLNDKFKSIALEISTIFKELDIKVIDLKS